MLYRFAIYSFLWIVLAGGCSYIPTIPTPWSAPAPQPNAGAEALFAEGMSYFNNKRYVLAIDRFQRVKTDFPFAPEVLAAELKIAEAYFLNKQYPEAIAAFKEFHALHPTNEHVPFVLYHLGLAHLNQFTAIDRDQKNTQIAQGYFENVVKDHPKSPYAVQAREKLVQSLEYLAQHEFDIASFYFRERKYPAAIDRLESILRRYRDTATAAKALYYLGESYRLEKNSLKAALAYEALVQHFPTSPFVKEARSQLAQLEKETHDPLALLLAQDRRVAYLPPAEKNQQKTTAGQQRPLNLVAKNEVVHEEPGDNKGILRRVAGTLNPLSWFSSSEDKNKEKETEKVEVPRKDSDGFFASLWKGLNPFGKQEQSAASEKDPQLVAKVDESLKQKGIASKKTDRTPPAANLPKVEEPAPPPPPADTTELLGRIDTNLKKEGKNLGELPPPPEPAPIFKSAITADDKPAAPKVQTPSTPATGALVADIDKALKRKGIDPATAEIRSITPVEKTDGQETGRAPSAKRVELDSKVTLEKGPLFLDSAEYQATDKPKETREAKTPEELKGSEPSTAPPSQPSKELPQAVVKGPAKAQKEKAAETKPAEKKKAEEGEEKGVFEQLTEELRGIGKLLNPFNW